MEDFKYIKNRSSLTITKHHYIRKTFRTIDDSDWSAADPFAPACSGMHETLRELQKSKAQKRRKPPLTKRWAATAGRGQGRWGRRGRRRGAQAHSLCPGISFVSAHCLRSLRYNIYACTWSPPWGWDIWVGCVKCLVFYLEIFCCFFFSCFRWFFYIVKFLIVFFFRNYDIISLW